MRIRLIFGALLAAALVAVGALVGSVVGTATISAQTTTPPKAPATSATPAAPSNPAVPGAPFNGPGGKGRGFGGPGFGGPGFGGPGFAGPGFGGFEGHGGGGPGGFRGGPGANANGASRAISNTADLITQVKADLAYANGKMDTTNLTKWVNGADAQLANARTAATASQLEKAGIYARTASELAEAAEGQMAYTLGADKLPSYSQRPQRRVPDQANKPALTQAQASRLLAQTYQNLVMQAAIVKGSNVADATTYLTDAQNAYKDAYSAYQAAKYNDAASKARLAGQLAGVANQLARAGSVPNDPNTPVTVPAPTF